MQYQYLLEIKMAENGHSVEKKKEKKRKWHMTGVQQKWTYKQNFHLYHLEK